MFDIGQQWGACCLLHGDLFWIMLKSEEAFYFVDGLQVAPHTNVQESLQVVPQGGATHVLPSILKTVDTLAAIALR